MANPKFRPKKDKKARKKLLRLLSLISAELGVIYSCILSLTTQDPALEEFEDTLYIPKERVCELWEDWQNHPEDLNEQAIARRTQSRCREIIRDPGLTWEDKITKLGIAYSLAYMKRDRLYRIIEKPVKVTRYQADGAKPVCRVYWNDGETSMDKPECGKNRICRVPIEYYEALKAAIAAGDTGKMLAKIKATGQREVMPWVPAWEQFLKEYLK